MLPVKQEATDDLPTREYCAVIQKAVNRMRDFIKLKLCDSDCRVPIWGFYHAGI